MSDSIDLLEAVGRDASLRRLPPDELACRLKAAGATEVLASAAGQRDSSLLCEEFGTRLMVGPNHGNEPFHYEPVPLKVPTPGDNKEDEEENDEQPNPSASAISH